MGEEVAPSRTPFEITSELASDMASLISFLLVIGHNVERMHCSLSAFDKFQGEP